MILIILIRKEECSENDHFLNTKILKKYSSFYVLLFDSGPIELNINKDINTWYEMIFRNVVLHYKYIFFHLKINYCSIRNNH